MNNDIYIASNGKIVAKTDYQGQVAFYLKSCGKYIEKKFYDKISSYQFTSSPQTGLLSVVFFFKKINGDVFIRESGIYFFDKKKLVLMPIEYQEVVEGDDFKITYYNQNSKITFITFNGARSKKNTYPFAANYVLKKGWNLISVAQDNNSQYQGLSLDLFHKSIKSIILGKEVYVYGSSLGGYCALYFGSCLNATIIAASPRNSAHPLISDDEWRNLDFVHIPLKGRYDNPVYVTFDSKITKDVVFLEDVFLPFYPNISLLPLPGASHNVLDSMLKAGVLGIYIDSIVFQSYNNIIKSYIDSKYMFYRKDYKEAYYLLDSVFSKKILNNINEI